MAGFGGFGAPNTNISSTTGSYTFGNKPNTPSTGFSLGGSTNPPLFGGTGSQPTFGSAATLPSFGSTTPQTGAGLFGSPAVSTSSNMFGSPSFGAPATANLTFGQPSTQPPLSFGNTGGTSGGSLSFGQPAATSSLSGLTFGTPATQSGNVSFGLTLTTTPSLQFGLPTASVTPLSFGATSTGFASTLGGTSTGLGFGAPNVTATSNALPFGTPASTGTGFGVNPTSSSLGFQGFSTPATTAAKPLGLSFGSTPASTAGSLGLSLAAPTQTGFGLGTSTSTGLFGSLGSKPLGLGLGSSVAPSLSFGATTTSAPAVTQTLGLGGIDTTQTKAGQTGGTTGRIDNVKENQIPNEIVQTIEHFKNFVKEQKGYSSDIARGSIKSLDKVREDTDSLKQMLVKLATSLQKYRAQTDHLKSETAAAMRNAEMAQHTHDTPSGMQYDNVAPLQYFVDLVASFEHEMQMFRQEIETTEKHIKSLIEPRALTPQELTTAMKRLHDSFVALAGRLQTVHNSVEIQKDQYLNLRKYFLKDSSNVFNDAKKSPGVFGKPVLSHTVSLGPTPFSAMGSQHGYGLHSTSTADTSQMFSTVNPTGWGGNTMQNTNLSSSLLGSMTNPLSLNTTENQGFVLQKPPGTKRGKR